MTNDESAGADAAAVAIAVPPPAAPPNLIQVEALRAGYGHTEVLHGIDFTVAAGSWDVILGPNGAGKSTTLKTLMGQLGPMAGRTTLCGHDCWTDSLTVKRHVGYLPEELYLYPELTGMENLLFAGDMFEIPRRELPGRIDQLLTLLDLKTDAHRQAREYSLGMKRKLGICLALLHRPRVLLLDEPMNGLDPIAAETVRATLSTLRQQEQLAILMSTHNLGMIHRYCDHVLIFFRGRVWVRATPAALSAQYPNLSLEEIFLHVVNHATPETQT